MPALAPNLKHLVIVVPRTAQAAPASRRRASAGPQEPWKGFASLSKYLKRGALESFVHMGLRNIDLDKLMELSKYTDLSKMCHLNIGNVLDSQILRFMNESIDFESLEALALNLEPVKGLDHHVMVSAYETLLERVPPPQDIHLGGYLTHGLLKKLFQ